MYCADHCVYGLAGSIFCYLGGRGRVGSRSQLKMTGWAGGFLGRARVPGTQLPKLPGQ